MRILTRYVLREFLIPLFYCLTGFVSIYVLFDLFGSFSRLAEADLAISDIALYFCGYFSPYVQYLVPAALLLATLYTMWSFCRHSEIVAMRASGVSFLAIVKPLLAVAIFCAAGGAWVNESFVPAKAQWASQLKTNKFDAASLARTDNIVLRNAVGGRTWNADALQDGRGSRLANVRVTVDRPNGGARLMNVTAPKAEFLDGEWWLTDAKVQHFDVRGQETATPTPELDALPFRCFPEFDERPEDFLMQNRPWKFTSVRERFRYLENHPDLSAEVRRGCVYDAWALLLSPLACLVITLFAIPAGIASGRQSVFRGILGALGMFFAFYGVTLGLMVVANGGWVPPVVAAALPHILFLALGIHAFRKQR